MRGTVEALMDHGLRSGAPHRAFDPADVPTALPPRALETCATAFWIH
jgi:hypothetical protein